MSKGPAVTERITNKQLQRNLKAALAALPAAEQGPADRPITLGRQTVRKLCWWAHIGIEASLFGTNIEKTADLVDRLNRVYKLGIGLTVIGRRRKD